MSVALLTAVFGHTADRLERCGIVLVRTSLRISLSNKLGGRIA
jgi:hypothetical protein